FGCVTSAPFPAEAHHTFSELDSSAATLAAMSIEAQPPATYDDLRAVYINCTLKRSPETSNTQGLMNRSISLMRAQGVAVDSIRFIDHDVATGIYPDMREHGWKTDVWSEEIWPQIEAADILV